MKRKVIILTILISSFSVLYGGPNGNDAWYLATSIGSGGIFQTLSGKDLIDKDNSDLTNSFVFADIGVYGLATYNLMLGVSGNIAGDFYRYENAKDINLFNSLLALSGVYYFSGDIGSGFYARADIGTSLLSKTADNIFSNDKNYTDFGWGFTLGGGFAINFGGTSLLIESKYSYRGIDNNGNNTFDKGNYDTNILGISLGLLF